MSDKLLRDAGEFNKARKSKIKCKNFSICGNYIPEDYINECDQLNNTYICPDCLHNQDKEEMGKD